MSCGRRAQIKDGWKLLVRVPYPAKVEGIDGDGTTMSSRATQHQQMYKNMSCNRINMKTKIKTKTTTTTTAAAATATITES